MKAKLSMILLAVLFMVPMSEASLAKRYRHEPHFKKRAQNMRILTRVPIDYYIDVQEAGNRLQIIFQFSLYDADIIATDESGDIVINESQTNIYEGMTIYINTPEAYPYALEIISPTVEITGEIVLEEN